MRISTALWGAARYVAMGVMFMLPLLLQVSTFNLLDFLDIEDGCIGRRETAAVDAPLSKACWFVVSGSRDKVQLKMALALSGVAFILTMVADLIAVYLPYRSLRALRGWYIDNVAADEWKKVLAPGVRVSILHATRPALFPLCKRFAWVWSYGFDPGSHHGAGIRLWTFQGVSGQSYRSELSTLVRLTPPLSGWLDRGKWTLSMMRYFRLGPRQAWKLRHVRAVLSVPLVLEHRQNRSRAIGVLNLDTMDETAAAFLEQEQAELVKIFLKDGATIAHML